MRTNLLAAPFVLLPLVADASMLLPAARDPVETARLILDDQVEGGCWTNIRETETYLSDQLKLMGVEATSETQSPYRIALSVVGQRLPDGTCFGAINIDIWQQRPGGRGIPYRMETLGWYRTAFAGGGKINETILDFVRDFTRAWRDFRASPSSEN